MKKAIILMLAFVFLATDAFCSDVFTLDTLSINAERTKMNDETSTVVDSIASATIQDRHVTSANDVLRLDSSINLRSNSKGMTLAPEVRGFPTETTQVLLGGTPVNTPWGHFCNLTFLPFRTFSSVSVVKSSESILYGANGMGGSLNIAMPEAVDLKGFRTRVEYSDRGNRHFEGTYGHVSEDGRNQHLFGIFSDLGSRNLRHTDYDIQSFMYRGKIELDKGYTLKLTSIDTSGPFQLPDRGEPLGPFQEKSSWKFSHKDIAVERELDNNQSFTLRFYRNDDIAYYNNYTNNTYTVLATKDSQTQYNYGSEILYNFDWGKKQRISLGFLDSHESISSPAIMGGKKNIRTAGGFISDKITFNEKLDLKLALRTDKNSEVGSENTWSATTNWKFANKQTLTLSGGQTQKFPSARELFMQSIVYLDPATGKWIYQVPMSGNPNVSSEKSKNFEIHWGYDIAKEWNVNVGFYKSIVTDYINRKFTNLPAPNPRMIWENLDTVDISGWETRLSGKLAKNWDLQFGYTRYLDVNDAATNKRVDLKNTYKFSGNIGWHGKRDRIRLFVENLGHAPYEARAPKGVKPSPAPYMTDIPSSTRVDFNWTRQLNSSASIFANIRNLTDDDIEVDQHSIGLSPIYEEPRTFTMGVETKF